ncbi:cuticle protein 2-like [Toxorhynchites rutilus septentrionalis]|uniref:cuticle protein 2-like n=1 Tax=Toxorhynchites rutilus septentrionalis TaxID=329112 RepID=UPI00247AD2A3|nr:cuticle protein 2-like [Toxorhynchites rutilus septentrionalis]
MNTFVCGFVLLLVAVCSGSYHGSPAGHWDHAPAQKWHGPLHVPVIEKGVPVEPPAVQHAKAAHAAAHAKLQAYGPGPGYGPAHDQHSGPAYGAWHGPQHIPVIKNGVPVETPEVQHAKAAHFNAVASAGAHAGAHGYEDDGSYKPHWGAHHY